MFTKTKNRLFINLTALTLMLVLVLILASTAIAGGKGPIVHSVTVGGPDICASFGLSPGCDASFSLQAQEYADGSVSGQYTDQFGHGNGGFHAVIDCLSVSGNQAWVSGVITHETFSGDGSFVGETVLTSVVDNGTSANDPLDQQSYSYISTDFSCTDQPTVDLFDVPQGQVKVK